VLSGAFAAHFPASISAMYETEHTATDQTQTLARDRSTGLRRRAPARL